MTEGYNLGSAYGTVEIGTDGAQQSIKSLSSALDSAGKSLTVGLTAPLLAAGGAALKFSTDLNEGMANVASLGIAADRVDELKSSVQNTAIEVGKSTDDMVGGLYQVISAFGDSADTASVLEINAKAAAAGLASTEEAINLTSAVTKGYGDTSAEAVQKAADLAQQTVILGQTTFPELAGSVGKVVPLMASLGGSQEELFATMATATGVTGNAAEVSTQLRGVLQSLMAPTKDMTALMSSMGYETGAAMLQGEGLQGVIEAVTAKAAESGDPLQKYIGSIEGQTLALALAGPQAEVYAEKLDAMNNAAGASSAAFDAQTKGINKAGFSMKQASIKFQVMMQRIGDGLAPALGAVMDMVQPLADQLVVLAGAFASADPQIQMVTVGVAALAASAGPVMLALSGVATALGVLLSPIGLVIAAVAALVAGWVAWTNNIGDVQGQAAKLAGTIKDLAKSATGIDFDAIGDGVRSFGDYIGAVLEDGDYLNDWLTHLPESVQPAAEAFGRFVAAVGELWKTGDIGAFVQELRDMFPEAAAAVDGAVGGVTKAIGEISDAITSFREGNLDVPELIWNIANALTGGGADYYVIRDAVNAIGTAWQSVQGAALAMWTWLQVAIPAAVEAMRSAWTTAWPAIQEAFAAAWGTVSGGLAAAWAWLQVALPAALGWLQSTWTAVWPAIQQATSSAWEAIRTGLTAAWVWLQETLPGALTSLQQAWGTAWPAINQAFSAAWSLVRTGLVNAWTWLQTQLPGALSALQTAWDAAWPALQTAATTAIDAVNGAFDNLKSAFTSVQTGASQVQGTLSGFLVQVTAIGAIVAAFFAPAVERLQTAFAALPEKLAPLMPKLQELGGAFMGLIQSLAPFAALIGVGLAIAADFGVNALAAVLNNLPGLVGPIIDQVTATLRLISTVLTEVISAVQAAIDGDWNAVWESAKTVINEFNTFFRGLFSRLGTFLGAVGQILYDAIVDTLRDMGIDVAPILEGIRKTFEDIWTKVQGYIQPVIDLVATITTKIGEFKDFLGSLDLPNPFAGLASAGQAVMDAIGGIGNAASGGGADGDPSTPQAIGTSYFRGGTAQINERGYEQIVLPAGARIYTNGQTNNLPTSEGKTFNINLGGVTVRSEADARRLGDILRDQLVMAGA